MELQEALRLATSKLGYSSLKTKQMEGIVRFLEGRDVFIALPTGSGKSACYHILPLAFDLIKYNSDESKSIAIIISPLNALIKDQIVSLSEKGLCGVHVTSNLGDEMIDRIQEGCVQYLFFSPESLLGVDVVSIWRDMLQTEIYQKRVVAIIVDEAHVVQKWGLSFRKEFSNLGELRSLFPSIKMMALTATATKHTRQQICRSLGMESAYIVSQSPNRPNIILEVDLMKTSVDDAFLPLVENIKLKREQTDRTIVFCRTYNSCTYIYHFFRSSLGDDMTEPRGYINQCELRIVDMFTACTQPDVKEKILQQFRDPNSCLRVIIATVAFGMGLDCPNVRHIIHWGLAPDVESYLQESGRAGRDGAPSTAKMFGAVKDGVVFSDDSMKAYLKLQVGECRRKYLLNHFDCNHDSTSTSLCRCCDNCRSLCLCNICLSQ